MDCEALLAALDLIDELELDSFYLYHAVRADPLRRLQRYSAATAAYARAAAMAPTQAERNFLSAGGRGRRGD